jgi:hypothetical protein
MLKNTTTLGAVILAVTLVVGQVLAFVLNANGYATFVQTLPIVLSQVAFWGPIMAIIAGGFIFITLRLLGFNTLEEIRTESVEQNNPTPAIVFVGTLIASLLFLGLVIRP